MLSFISSRQNWDSPTLSPAGECAPILVPGGGDGASSDEGTYTLKKVIDFLPSRDVTNQTIPGRE